MSRQADIKFMNELMVIYFFLSAMTQSWVLRAIIIWRIISLLRRKTRLYIADAKDGIAKSRKSPNI